IDKALKGDTRAFATVLQATARHPRGEPGGGPDGGPDGDDPDGGAAGAGNAQARDRLLDRLDGLARRHADERDRLAAALAAAGVAEAHLAVLFGPRGDRLRDATTAALRDARARGFDVRQVAEVAVFAAVAGECAEALLGDGGQG
ncbi:hypothetical protein, partial [Thalassobaculum sp.]|uniref:hypothetical protein n=1 Tax=Thalassobaculum sp. TaxID=2022740 RepID=UPI0032EACC4E